MGCEARIESTLIAAQAPCTSATSASRAARRSASRRRRGPILAGDGSKAPPFTIRVSRLPRGRRIRRRCLNTSARRTGGPSSADSVYRGAAIPELEGKYVFADFGNSNSAGVLYYGIIDSSDPNYGKFFELQIDDNGPKYPSETGGVRLMPDQIVSLGEDEHGELYLVAGEDLRHQLDPTAFIIKLTAIPEPNADFDSLGGATLDDFHILRSNYLATGALHAQGDANFDGVVDHEDFFLWRSAYLAGGGDLAAISWPAPEPSAWALAMIACAALGLRLRKPARVVPNQAPDGAA